MEATPQTKETPKLKETILKTKECKQKKQLTDEAREALAMRMREINDKRILATAEKIKKTKGEMPKPADPELEPVPAMVVAEPPKPAKKKRVIKVIELSDSEDEEEPQVIAVRKLKAKKVSEPEHLEKPKERKPRVPKPTPVIPPTPEPPRGRFL